MLSVIPRQSYYSYLVDTEFFICDPYKNTYLKITILDGIRIHSIGVFNHIKVDIVEMSDLLGFLDFLNSQSRTSRIIIRMKDQTKLFAYGLDYEAREKQEWLICQLTNRQYRAHIDGNRYWPLYVFCPRYFS